MKRGNRANYRDRTLKVLICAAAYTGAPIAIILGGRKGVISSLIVGSDKISRSINIILRSAKCPKDTSWRLNIGIGIDLALRIRIP